MILGDRSFTDGDGNSYTLRLGVAVRGTILDAGHVETTVTAIRHVHRGDDIELTALVRLEPFERRLAIFLPGRDPIHIDIEYFEGLAGHDEPEVDALAHVERGDAVEQAARDTLAGAGVDEAVETAIQRLPVPEPAFGCLVKAGVSTMAGQLIRCHNRHRRIEQRRSRAWQIVKCLGVNAPGMTIRAGLRTLGCWLSLGVL